MKTYILVGLLISSMAFAGKLPKVFPECGPDHTRKDIDHIIHMSLQYTNGFHTQKYGGEPNASVYASFCIDKEGRMDGPAFIYQYYGADPFTVVVEKLVYEKNKDVAQHWLKTTKKLYIIETGMEE